VTTELAQIDPPLQQVAPPVVDRPKPKGRVGYHAIMLLGSLCIISAAALLHLDAGGTVEMPGGGGLPALCIWRQALGINCPGCGLTRSFVALAHGHWLRAWQFNPAGLFMFAVVAYQLPYRSVQIWRLRRGLSERPHSPLVIGVLAWGAAAALIVQWAWRMM
jgi:hypothetical protein